MATVTLIIQDIGRGKIQATIKFDPPAKADTEVTPAIQAGFTLLRSLSDENAAAALDCVANAVGVPDA